MTEMTCEHCDDSIDTNDRFVELQPGGFQSDGEMYRDNMAWFVHGDCVAEFAEGMEA